MLPIFPVIGAVLVMGAPSQSSYPHGMYRWLVPHPTGANGYEDYLRAADILSKNGKAKLPYVPYTVVLDDKVTWNSLISKNQKALELIHEGNLKKVWDPRVSYDENTAMPEFASFKALAKLLTAKALLLANRGDSKGATDCLLDSFRFADKIPPSSLISYLVSLADQSIDCRGAYLSLPNLKPADISRLDAYLASRPSARASAEAAIDSDLDLYRDLAKKSINSRLKVLRDPESRQDFLATAMAGYADSHNVSVRELAFPNEPDAVLLRSTHSTGLDKFLAIRHIIAAPIAAIEGASATQKRTYDLEEDQYTEELKNAVHKDLERPESHWSISPLPVPSKPEIQIFYYVYEEQTGWDNVVNAAARHDAEMRLLRLNCVLRLYKNKHGAYPKALESLNQPMLAQDPRTEREFDYALTPTGYTLTMNWEGSLKPRVY